MRLTLEGADQNGRLGVSIGKEENMNVLVTDRGNGEVVPMTTDEAVERLARYFEVKESVASQDIKECLRADGRMLVRTVGFSYEFTNGGEAKCTHS